MKSDFQITNTSGLNSLEFGDCDGVLGVLRRRAKSGLKMGSVQCDR